MTNNENMKVAQCLFARWGKELLADWRIHGLLEALREKVAASGRVARELGLVAACKHCEEEEGGSCCGAGIEDRYTPHLLLINLLLGRTLPADRRFADSCHFLGTDGCTLMAREILCINYLCPNLQRSLAHENLVRLQATTGEEMETVFRLHEAVKRFLADRSRDLRP